LGTRGAAPDHNAGADHIIDIGGRDTIRHSLHAVSVGGTIDVIGGVGGGVDVEMPLRHMIRRTATLRGIAVGNRMMCEAMTRAIARHQLRPAIDRVFPFEEAPAAYARVKSAAHFGKVVIAI
jgi:NADPH:quinone reductase-like Zn-dependent oxidoreductase